MSAKTKTSKSKKPQPKAVKKPVAAKPAAKAPAKKTPPPAKKTPPAKKAVSAKKAAPAPKATPAKKATPVKKAVPVKKVASAKKSVPQEKKAPAVSAKPVKKEVTHKPITVINKATRPPLKKPEEPVMFENQSQELAFSFAEQMKQKHRAEEELKRKQANPIRLSRRPTTRTKGKDTQQFPAADLAEFRKRLILLRQEVLGQSATLRTIALEQTEERGSEDEDGSDAFLRLQNLSQVDSQNKVIQKIDEALHRIDEGTYGICEVCGQLIRKPRLMNLPFVHTCMECQSEMENPFGSR